MKTPGEIYKEQLRAEKELSLRQSVPMNQQGSKKQSLLIILLVLLLIGGGGVVGIITLRGSDQEELQPVNNELSKIVLSDTVSMTLRISSQAIFESTSQFLDEVTYASRVILNDSVSMINQDIDLGTGSLFSLNIPDVFLESVTGGTGMDVTTGANPVITNTGVLSFGGSVGDTLLAAGEGMSVDSLTITNSDKGSSQSIFKTITVIGQTDVTAGSNTDSLTFIEGTGITLTTIPDAKSLVITGSGGGGPEVWIPSGSDVYYDSGNVGIGILSPQATLDVSGTMNITGVTNIGGILAVTGAITAGSDGTINGIDISMGALSDVTSLTLNSDQLTDFNGTGLQLIGTTLETVLGSAVNLASVEVTGVLPEVNGGTNSTTLNDLIALGTMSTGNFIATITGDSQMSVSGSGSEIAAVTLSLAGDSIGDTQLAYNTGQNLTSVSSPTFDALSVTSMTLSGNTITDFNGTGLQVLGNVLQIVLGMSIDLTNEVTGMLPEANGGTNLPSLSELISLGSMTTGEYAQEISGNTQIGVTGSGMENAGVVLSLNGDSIGDTQLAFDTGQHLTSTASPTFTALTVTSLVLAGNTVLDFTGTGLQMNGTTLETSLGVAVTLTSEVTGILPVAQGGTGINSIGTAGRIAYSNGTTYTFSSAGIAGQLLTSGGGSLPTWESVSIFGTNYWQRALGAIAPVVIEDDLLIGGSATVSALTKFGGTSGSSTYLNTGGNVGVGTTNPTSLLHLQSDQNAVTELSIRNQIGPGNTSAQTALTLVGRGNGGGIYAYPVDAGTGRWQDRIVLRSDSNSSGLSFDVTNAGQDIRFYAGGTTESMRIASTGNVGIGTTNPGAFKLVVAGHIGPSADVTYDLGSDTRRFRDLYISGSSIHMGTSGDEGTIGYDTTNDYMTFNPSDDGTPEFVMTDTGNLGIGTTNPTEKLTMNGGNFLLSAGNPTQAGVLNSASGATGLGGANDVYVSGKYAYVTSLWDNTLTVVDISEPTSPVEVGVISVSTAGGVYVSGKYAYVISSGYNDGRLSIIDISDPSSPVLVSEVFDETTTSGTYDVYVSGKYAYLTTAYGLSVFDVSDPTDPAYVSIFGEDQGSTALFSPSSLYVSGNYAYVTDAFENSLTIVDISDPSGMTEVGVIVDGTDLNGANSVYVSGRYAYVTSYTALSIIDISDLSSPTEVGVITDGIGATELEGVSSIYVAGIYAYLTSRADDALTVVDISDPSTPTQAGVIKDGVGATDLAEAQSVFVSGKYAYVASGTDNAFTVIDISGIDTPAASIGSISSNNIHVSENMFIGNNLNVGTAINVGSGGIMSDGDVTSSGDLTLAGTIRARNAPVPTSLSRTLTTVDSTGTVGEYASLAIGADGYPVISHFSSSGSNLKVVKCGDAACSSGNTITTVDSTGDVGRYASLALGADGYPVISYYDLTNQDLKVVKCGNAACTSGNIITTVDSTGNVGWYISLAIGADGYPVISYHDFTNQDLKVVKCGNAACTSGNTITAVDSTGNMGHYTSLTIGTDGYPVISYRASTGSNLKVVKCGNAACSSGNTATTVDSTGDVGEGTSIAIGADGYPVISYRDLPNEDLKVAKCGNAACSSGNTTTIVDSTGAWEFSLSIGTDGYPIISYYVYTDDDLKVVKCGNAACSSGNTTTTLESTGDIGRDTSLAIGTDGYPVISYRDVTNADLKVAKCVDASCASTSGTTYTGGQDIGSMDKSFNNVFATRFWGKELNVAFNADVAENYNVEGEAVQGDILRAKDGTTLTRTTEAYDASALGIVSTAPAIRLSAQEGSTPVALVGRVPVNIASSSEPIRAGDSITTSSEPGKGMKATRAGIVLGVALDSWNSSDEDGQILVFVNRSYFDPDMYITQTGNISVIADATIETGLERYMVQRGEQKVERKGLYADLFAGDISAGEVNASRIMLNGVDLLVLIGSGSGVLGDSSLSTPSNSAGRQNDILGNQDENSTVILNSIQDLKVEVASLSAQFASLASLSTSAASNATTYNDLLEQILQSSLLAMSDNLTADADLLHPGTTYVSSNLSVSGRTIFADFDGEMISAGNVVLSGSSGSIDTHGTPLKLQSMGLSSLELMEGQMKIDTEGNILIINSLTTEKLSIEDTSADRSIGDVVVKAGDTDTIVETSALTEDSRIFFSSDIPAGIGVERYSETKFRVWLEQKMSNDVSVSWWIVN